MNAHLRLSAKPLVGRGFQCHGCRTRSGQAL